MKCLIRSGLILLILLAPAQASDQAVIVRTATVHAEASSTSPRVGQISAGSQVSLFARKGGWQEIFSEQKSIIGWVRSYQVRSGNFEQPSSVETREDSRGFLSGLASFSRKASSFFNTQSGTTSSGTATLGVRGLSAEEIQSAQADFAQLEKMKSFSSNRKRMQGFTRNGKLRPLKVNHIAGK